MKATILLLFVSLLILKSFVKEVESSQITCEELRNINAIGSLIVTISSKRKDSIDVDFYLASRKNREPVLLGPNDWSALETDSFDPSKKTIFITHGYKSGGRKGWVLAMKDALLDARDVNVILVDWSSGANHKNYVDSARNTELASNRIFNFLQILRQHVERLNKPKNNPQWNHLYFIGHSLGAQISGQVANLLNKDNFWKVERITGLDPAKPCFKEVEDVLKLDKTDADFVDIIHTQTGKGGNVDGLGLVDNVGHMDFYLNGGVSQPGCVGSKLIPRWEKMICSHKLSYKYFTESVINSLNPNKCKFRSFPWDGTFEEAEQILNEKIEGSSCMNCPVMGLDAPKSNRHGTFLVITAAKEPYCEFERRDEHDMSTVARVLQKLKGIKSFFGRKSNH